MADYQAQFKRVLNKEVSNYAARPLRLLARAIQAKGLVRSEELPTRFARN